MNDSFPESLTTRAFSPLFAPPEIKVVAESCPDLNSIASPFLCVGVSASEGLAGVTTGYSTVTPSNRGRFDSGASLGSFASRFLLNVLSIFKDQFKNEDKWTYAADLVQVFDFSSPKRQQRSRLSPVSEGIYACLKGQLLRKPWNITWKYQKGKFRDSASSGGKCPSVSFVLRLASSSESWYSWKVLYVFMEALSTHGLHFVSPDRRFNSGNIDETSTSWNAARQTM